MTDKTAIQHYRLIDGLFSPEQAKEILMVLIEDKIKFHRRSDLSLKERFGESDGASTRRIEELLQTKADLEKLINDSQVSDRQLAINCTIEIKCLPD